MARLQPANAQMDPIMVPLAQLSIQGRVLAVHRQYRWIDPRPARRGREARHLAIVRDLPLFPAEDLRRERATNCKIQNKRAYLRVILRPGPAGPNAS